MGNEAACTLTFKHNQHKGKALLETSELIFRGADGFRLKIVFSQVKSAKATDGELHLQTLDGLAVFDLGTTAEKWCNKILHPKTRLEKIGVKSQVTISIVGEIEPEFLQELGGHPSKIVKNKVAADSDLVFVAAEGLKDLAHVAKLAKSLRGAAALWIVYPKGQKHITEVDVIGAGRKAGLKDVKVVGFSATRTALKFVIPVKDR
jgi:hypothetical protein